MNVPTTAIQSRHGQDETSFRRKFSLAATNYPRSPDIAATIMEIAGASAARVSNIRAELTVGRESVPLDIPYQLFQGPF